MKIDNYSDLQKKCKNIIKNNTPEKSLDIISNIQFDNKGKVGMDNAINIYKCFAVKSIEWDDKYSNNITSFKNKVHKNLKNAINHGKNNI